MLCFFVEHPMIVSSSHIGGAPHGTHPPLKAITLFRLHFLRMEMSHVGPSVVLVFDERPSSTFLVVRWNDLLYSPTSRGTTLCDSQSFMWYIQK